MPETYGINIAEPQFEWLFDLQYFAEDSPTGQKTEDATPKRREDARKDGQVPKSRELNTAVQLLAGFVALYFLGSYYLQELATFMRHFLVHFTEISFTYPVLQLLITEIMTEIARLLLPLFVVLIITCVAGNIYQFGFVFTTKPLHLDVSKLNPVSGFKRIFKLKQLMELPKALAKLMIIAYIPYSDISASYGMILNLINIHYFTAITAVAGIIFKIILKIALLLIILGYIDFKYQNYEFEKSIKMSKYDVKQEAKNRDIDPRVKAKILRQGHEMLKKAMMQEVPKADVVITNPIHIAVAVKYDSERSAAPFIVAKGKNLIAEKIKEIARKSFIPIVENKLLARELDRFEIGDEIPPELYAAVAEILASIYQTNQKMAS